MLSPLFRLLLLVQSLNQELAASTMYRYLNHICLKFWHFNEILYVCFITKNSKYQACYLFFQDGFGWTNGVILDLLVTYSDRMTIADIGDELTPKPIKPCRKKTNRIDYNIIIMIMLHAIIFYFAKCAFPLQI